MRINSQTEVGNGVTTDAVKLIQKTNLETESPRSALWDAIARLQCPLLVVRGGASPVVDDEDIEGVKKYYPSAEIVVVDGAGHSVQGDRPIEMAAHLRRFV